MAGVSHSPLDTRSSYKFALTVVGLVIARAVNILVGTLLLDERLADPTWRKAVAYAGLALALAAAVSITRATEEAKTADAVTSIPSVGAPAT